MDNPYEWLQSFIAQVPEILQPLIVALAGAIPYIEGEGAAEFGRIAGLNPLVAAVAGATVLGPRRRQHAVRRRTAPTETGQATGLVLAARLGESSGGTGSGGAAPTASAVAPQTLTDDTDVKPTRRAKGRERLGRGMVRFGVPGASLLAPLALPTMLTAAFFVGAGVPKQWVILWQVIAIVLWTSAVAIAATGVLALLGW